MALVAAARALASESGMGAVQIVPVAERAGIAAGTVYRYFPSKDDLVAALVAVIAEQEIAAIRRTAAAAPGPLSALAAAIQRSRSVPCGSAGWPSLCWRARPKPMPRPSAWRSGAGGRRNSQPISAPPSPPAICPSRTQNSPPPR
jgi:AcrR family transcriptional regulator